MSIYPRPTSVMLFVRSVHLDLSTQCQHFLTCARSDIFVSILFNLVRNIIRFLYRDHFRSTERIESTQHRFLPLYTLPVPLAAIDHRNYVPLILIYYRLRNVVAHLDSVPSRNVNCFVRCPRSFE